MKTLLYTSLIIAGAALGGVTVQAAVTLASPFTAHMVLQRDMKAPVWGTAAAGEEVTVEFAGQKKTTTASADKTWRVDLDPLATSAESRTMTVSGTMTAQPIQLDDVLVGEVWLASGQSNMVFPVEASGPYHGLINYEGEIAAAKYPEIRMFTAKDTKAHDPQATVSGNWVVCSPDTVGQFSAVGYVFARDLQLQLKVPVGIVCSASGASCAEAWISRETITADASIKPYLDAFDADYNYFKADPATRPAVAPVRATPINKPRTGAPATGDPSRDQHMPTVLFNGMINPLIPYAIRGAIWYQGESIDGGTPGLMLYGHIMQTLIKDWRGRWGEGDFTFLEVQLPGQKNISNNPLIREQQQTILALPNTGMSVAIDTGEENNVHPQNKQPTGYRLALLALAKAYGQNIEYSGPMYDSMAVEGGNARIKFTHVGGGLVAKGGELKGFQIAGVDQKFYDATAKVDGTMLVVSSPQVPAPVAVRYAWDDFPEGLGCNLYNSYDLPAAPFRTDNWNYPIPGIVEN
jgi:sialate O-acetylesterase